MDTEKKSDKQKTDQPKLASAKNEFSGQPPDHRQSCSRTLQTSLPL
jgi:hypothetical protein